MRRQPRRTTQSFVGQLEGKGRVLGISTARFNWAEATVTGECHRATATNDCLTFPEPAVTQMSHELHSEHKQGTSRPTT